MDNDNDYERTKEYLKGQLPMYLRSKSINTNSSFNCFNPEHNDTEHSMYYDKKTRTVHCKKCNARYDIFAIIGMEFNLSSFQECFNKVHELYLGPAPSNEQSLDANWDQPQNTRSNQHMIVAGGANIYAEGSGMGRSRTAGMQQHVDVNAQRQYSTSFGSQGQPQYSASFGPETSPVQQMISINQSGDVTTVQSPDMHELQARRQAAQARQARNFNKNIPNNPSITTFDITAEEARKMAATGGSRFDQLPASVAATVVALNQAKRKQQEEREAQYQQQQAAADSALGVVEFNPEELERKYFATQEQSKQAAPNKVLNKSIKTRDGQIRLEPSFSDTNNDAIAFQDKRNFDALPQSVTQSNLQFKSQGTPNFFAASQQGMQQAKGGFNTPNAPHPKVKLFDNSSATPAQDPVPAYEQEMPNVQEPAPQAAAMQGGMARNNGGQNSAFSNPVFTAPVSHHRVNPAREATNNPLYPIAEPQSQGMSAQVDKRYNEVWGEHEKHRRAKQEAAAAAAAKREERMQREEEFSRQIQQQQYQQQYQQQQQQFRQQQQEHEERFNAAIAEMEEEEDSPYLAPNQNISAYENAKAHRKALNEAQMVTGNVARFIPESIKNGPLTPAKPKKKPKQEDTTPGVATYTSHGSGQADNSLRDTAQAHSIVTGLGTSQSARAQEAALSNMSPEVASMMEHINGTSNGSNNNGHSFQGKTDQSSQMTTITSTPSKSWQQVFGDAELPLLNPTAPSTLINGRSYNFEQMDEKALRTSIERNLASDTARINAENAKDQYALYAAAKTKQEQASTHIYGSAVTPSKNSDELPLPRPSASDPYNSAKRPVDVGSSIATADTNISGIHAISVGSNGAPSSHKDSEVATFIQRSSGVKRTPSGAIVGSTAEIHSTPSISEQIRKEIEKTQRRTEQNTRISGVISKVEDNRRDDEVSTRISKSSRNTPSVQESLPPIDVSNPYSTTIMSGEMKDRFMAKNSGSVEGKKPAHRGPRIDFSKGLGQDSTVTTSTNHIAQIDLTQLDRDRVTSLNELSNKPTDRASTPLNFFARSQDAEGILRNTILVEDIDDFEQKSNDLARRQRTSTDYEQDKREIIASNPQRECLESILSILEIEPKSSLENSILSSEKLEELDELATLPSMHDKSGNDKKSDLLGVEVFSHKTKRSHKLDGLESAEDLDKALAKSTAAISAAAAIKAASASLDKGLAELGIDDLTPVESSRFDKASQEDLKAKAVNKLKLSIASADSVLESNGDKKVDKDDFKVSPEDMIPPITMTPEEKEKASKQGIEIMQVEDLLKDPEILEALNHALAGEKDQLLSKPKQDALRIIQEVLLSQKTKNQDTATSDDGASDDADSNKIASDKADLSDTASKNADSNDKADHKAATPKAGSLADLSKPANVDDDITESTNDDAQDVKKADTTAEAKTEEEDADKAQAEETNAETAKAEEKAKPKKRKSSEQANDQAKDSQDESKDSTAETSKEQGKSQGSAILAMGKEQQGMPFNPMQAQAMQQQAMLGQTANPMMQMMGQAMPFMMQSMQGMPQGMPQIPGMPMGMPNMQWPMQGMIGNPMMQNMMPQAALVGTEQNQVMQPNLVEQAMAQAAVQSAEASSEGQTAVQEQAPAQGQEQEQAPKSTQETAADTSNDPLKLGQEFWSKYHGLSLEIVDRYHLSFVPQLPVGTQMWSAGIIPLSEDCQQVLNAQSGQTFFMGDTVPCFNLDILHQDQDGASNALFVVSTALDALSLESLGAHAVALVQPRNADQLLEYLQESIQGTLPFYISLDHSTEWNEAKERLSWGFNTLQQPFKVIDLAAPYSSINQALMQDRTSLLNKVQNDEVLNSLVNLPDPVAKEEVPQAIDSATQINPLQLLEVFAPMKDSGFILSTESLAKLQLANVLYTMTSSNVAISRLILSSIMLNQEPILFAGSKMQWQMLCNRLASLPVGGVLAGNTANTVVVGAQDTNPNAPAPGIAPHPCNARLIELPLEFDTKTLLITITQAVMSARNSLKSFENLRLMLDTYSFEPRFCAALAPLLAELALNLNLPIMVWCSNEQKNYFEGQSVQTIEMSKSLENEIIFKTFDQDCHLQTFRSVAH